VRIFYSGIDEKNENVKASKITDNYLK